jgi:hypothetical protein
LLHPNNTLFIKCLQDDFETIVTGFVQ